MGGHIELPKISGGGGGEGGKAIRECIGVYRCVCVGGGGIIGSNAMCGGYYTVGNNAMYIQFKGVKGLVTVIVRKIFKIIA